MADAVRLRPFLVIAVAGRFAPGHRDAALTAALAGLFRQLLHRVLELGELLDRLLFPRLPAPRLSTVEVLLGAAHPVLRLLQHLLVLGAEDGELLAYLPELVAHLPQLLLETSLLLRLLPQPLQLLLRHALAFAGKSVLELLDDLL